MKFYIASRFENCEQVNDLAGKLKSAGWTQTHDWTSPGTSKESSVEMITQAGIRAFNGVKEADVIIILTPQGRGTHTELGMAIALNKRIYLCHVDDAYFKCDDNTSVFYWLPQVRQFVGSIDGAADMLISSQNEF